MSDADESLAHFIQSKVAEILRTQIDSLDKTLTLHQQGVKSIGLLMLKVHLEKELHAVIPNDVLDNHLTALELAQRILSEIESDGVAFAEATQTQQPSLSGPLYIDIVPLPQVQYEAFPLNDMQAAMLTGRRLRMGGDWVGCHNYCEFDCHHLDSHRLNRAWQRLVDYHPMLRVVILPGGQQRIVRGASFYKFTVFDFSKPSANGLSTAEVERELLGLRARLSHKVYQPEQWPLFDIRIVLLPANKARVYFSIDEWVVDAHSLNMLLEQWQALYRDPELSLPALRISFRDYLLAAREFEQSTRFQNTLARALQRYSDMPSGPRLPCDDREPNGPQERHARYRRRRLAHRLHRDAWQRLQQQAAAWKLSATSLLLGLFADTLRSRSENERFTLVLTYFNRPPLHSQLDKLVGPFISTQLLIMEPMQGEAVSERIKAVDKALREALDLSLVSGVRLLRELKTRGRVAADMTFPVVFTSLLDMQALAHSTAQQGALSEPVFEPVYELTQTPQVYLDCHVMEQRGELHICWDVAEELYAPGAVRELFDSYCSLLSRPEAVAQGHRDPWTPPALPVLRPAAAEHYQPFPLTAQQQAYGFARSQFLRGESNSCQLYCELDAVNLDLGRLRSAWQRLLCRHPMLTTRVFPGGRQQVMESIPDYTIEVQDFSHEPKAARATQLTSIKEAMIARSVALGEWPYFAVQVSLLPDNRARVHFTIDLLIADATSIEILIREWQALYRDIDTRLDALEISFRDCVMALEAYRETPHYREDLAYWQEKFRHFSGGPLLFGRRAAAAGTGRRQRHTWICTRWQALEARARSFSLPVTTVLLAAYLEVLARGCDNRPFEVVMPCWKRLPLHPQINRVVGDFTGMSWVAANLSEQSFLEKCRGYLSVMQADARHRAVNGILALRNARDKDNRPLRYPVVFSDLVAAGAAAAREDSEPDLVVGYRESKTGGVLIDHITDLVDGHAELHWDVSAAVFPQGAVENLFHAYTTLLRRLIESEQAWFGLQIQ